MTTTDQRGQVSPTTPATTSGETLLQRVVLPRPADPTAVRALYLDERPGTTLSPVEPLADERARPLSLTVSTIGGRRTRILDRTGATVPAATEVSFGAYFNAFAAGYWRARSTLTSIELRLDLEGSGRVDVYRTKADGSQIVVAGEVVEGRRRVTLELDLRPFEDGGWYWFDLSTDDADLTLHGGGWHARTTRRGARPSSSGCRRSTGPPTASPPSPRSAPTRRCGTRSPR